MFYAFNVVIVNGHGIFYTLLIYILREGGTLPQKNGPFSNCNQMNKSMINIFSAPLIHNSPDFQESGDDTGPLPDETESSPLNKFGHSVQILKSPHPGYLDHQATNEFTPDTSSPADDFSTSHLLTQNDMISRDWFLHANLNDTPYSFISNKPDNECTIVNLTSTETQPVVQSSLYSVATAEPLNKSTKQPILTQTANPESTESFKSVISIDLTLEDNPASEADKSSQTKYKTSLHRRESKARYAKTYKGRVSKAKYASSEKGKVSQARRRAKYLASDKGKKNRANYLASRKGKVNLAKKVMHSRIPIDQLKSQV